MNFKELREANLSKAQIKKVHDKADDLPKNDFIKRYGKDGDSVRFATATNIIKKQLGVESLDKEDEKSVGRVIKQLKKAVKAHQGQVDTLAKDIKDEFVEGGPGSGPQKSYKTIPKNETESEKDIRLDKATAVAKAANDKRISDAIKQFQKQDEKQKKKDKADTQRLLDRQKRLQSIGKRNEEVVTEAVSDAYVKQIARMTDNNDHFGARIELARMMRDKELMQMYDSLEKMHRMNLGGNDALTLRSKLDKNLKFRLTQKVKKDADRLMGAL